MEQGSQLDSLKGSPFSSLASPLYTTPILPLTTASYGFQTNIPSYTEQLTSFPTTNYGFTSTLPYTPSYFLEANSGLTGGMKPPIGGVVGGAQSNSEFIAANSKFLPGVDIMKNSGVPLSDTHSKVASELEKKFASTEKLLKRVDDLLERSYANSSRKPEGFLDNNNTSSGSIKLNTPSKTHLTNSGVGEDALHKRNKSTFDTPSNSNFIFKKAGELLEETFRTGFIETSKSNF